MSYIGGLGGISAIVSTGGALGDAVSPYSNYTFGPTRSIYVLGKNISYEEGHMVIYKNVHIIRVMILINGLLKALRVYTSKSTIYLA